MPGVSVDPAIAEKAEKLRLQGNDAFGTKDWKRAVELYKASVEHAESAKAYSNLAATLCKVSRYTEASEAAERATILEPKWAKGWWRRGVVAELLKFFGNAYQYYSIAAELSPQEKTFISAREKVGKRLKIREEAGGRKVMEAPKVDSEEFAKEPSIVAWAHFCENNPEQLLSVYVTRQRNFSNGENPKSEQFFVQGLHGWSRGLKDAVASLTIQKSRQHATQYEMLRQQGLPPDAVERACVALLGGDPESLAYQYVADGFSHLGGVGMALQMGGGPGGDAPGPSLCPQPAALSSVIGYQHLSILFSIHDGLFRMLNTFGNDIKVSQALKMASVMCSANLGIPEIAGGAKAAKPKEVVDFIKQQLKKGHPWDGGLRVFVSLLYRGSILSGAIMRLFGQVAVCYEAETWARNFITLADEEFKVNEEGTFDEKGSTFRKSFRIGMMVSELQSLSTLQQGGALLNVDGPYSIIKSFDLCVDIINMANSLDVPRNPIQPEYCFVQNDVAFRRKPLAMAHSALGSQLSIYQSITRRDEWDAMTLHYGFRVDENDETTPFAVIAEHYRRAAEAELYDAQDKALFWWSCASFVARAGPASYSLGELRTIIAEAEQGEKDRDVVLFGQTQLQGASHETVARLTEQYFSDQPDSFVLPEVKIVDNKRCRSLKAGNEVICPNLQEYEEKDLAYDRDRKGRTLVDMMDTVELETTHGTDRDHGIPSLEVLCIRELHKQGCEYAVGETDATVIHHKFFFAQQKEAASK